MSKRALQKYLHTLSKEQLEEQILDLYTRFKEVKTFYNFVFNPKEEKLVEDCKLKISKEYFPINGRKPKMRRSVAQKHIKHFKQLGVESYLIADVMAYNLEIAQAFSAQKFIRQEAFYKSMLNSFQELLNYSLSNGLYPGFEKRIQRFLQEIENLQWPNEEGFHRVWEEEYKKFQKQT